ncbi:MAG: hypothetical protein N3F09_01265 [Bacteroidia bacterium]|nr:hypothetical protein [Bacteroidia bacterium]
MIFQLKKIYHIFHRGIYFFSVLALLEYVIVGEPKTVLEKNYSDDFLHYLTHLFFYQSRCLYYTLWSMAMLTACLGLFLYKRLFISDIMLWFILLNMNHYHFEWIHDGHYLIGLFVFLCAFFPDGVIIKADLKNIIWRACRIQWMMVYVLSGLFKLKSEVWRSGQAIHRIFDSDWFNPFLISFPTVVSMPLSYIVIAYQVTFPIIFFLNKIKKIYVLIGISMHLFIAVFMGLPIFGLFMCWLFLLALEGNNYLKTDTNPT